MKGMYIPPVGWLETLLYGQVDDFTDMMTPRHEWSTGWSNAQTGESGTSPVEHTHADDDPSSTNIDIQDESWRSHFEHRREKYGDESTDQWHQNQIDRWQERQGGDDGRTDPSGGDDGRTDPSGGDDGRTDPSGGDDGRTPSRRYRDDDDDGYSRRRRSPAVEPEPLPSAFATGEEGYAPEAIGALDTEEWVGALGDGEERVSLQGMEDERRAFLAQERDSERQQASKEQQEGAGRRDHLYDALWYSESTDELTEEQL